MRVAQKGGRGHRIEVKGDIAKAGSASIDCKISPERVVHVECKHQ